MTSGPLRALGAALAGATSGAVLVDVVDDLVLGLTTETDVDAAGILVCHRDGTLDLLSSSSHRAAELEMYQTSGGEGPCVDCIRSGVALTARGEEIHRRWPTVGAAILAAGLQTVLSVPMVSHGRIVGALNLFWEVPLTPNDDDQDLARTFADAAVVLLAQERDGLRLPSNIVSALSSRVLIETAKGALAEELGVSTADAYDELPAASSA